VSTHESQSWSRVIGAFPEDPRARGESRGSLVITIGGLHGNEPAGVEASRRVLEQLRRDRPEFRGTLFCLTGNLQALALGERYVTEDLNRVWTDTRIEELRTGDASAFQDEKLEQNELYEEMQTLLSLEWDDVILLDLHSTSASGSPFAIMADTLQNRKAAAALHIPVLLGLEERVEGTLLSYMSEQGHIALCVEGGQNDLESTVDHHESVIWMILVSAGLLDREDLAGLPEKQRSLHEMAVGLPRFVEVRHREAVSPGAEFQMNPGYSNFQRVERGDVLAQAVAAGVSTEVATPLGGLLLLPRYQGQGNDAFFIGRAVHPVWLQLSAVLRRLRLESLLPWFPGITRHPDRSRALRVNPHVARWLVVQILHLFGYRRSTHCERHLVFVRRRDDL